jgi:hypothetical protein
VAFISMTESGDSICYYSLCFSLLSPPTPGFASVERVGGPLTHSHARRVQTRR